MVINMSVNARTIAVTALCEVDKNGAYSNIALNRIFENQNPSGVERSFATALFYGVLDRKITIDHILSSYIKKPIEKIKPVTLEALRIAVYQICFTDKIPDFSAVNESVNIVKKSKESFNASFVNAVLRNILRNPVNLPQDDTINSLSIRYSCPERIIKCFMDDYGLDVTKKLLECSLESPQIFLRVNTEKITPEALMAELENEGAVCEPAPIKNAVLLKSGFDAASSKAYKNGFFHVEDLACQYCVEALSLKSGESMLDMCAAPGGKSFTAAQYVGQSGNIVSCDIYENRVDLIRKGAKRLGLDKIINAMVSDASVYNESLGQFDAVLCDVPCSGLGVIRRKPEIKYKKEDDFCVLQNIQADILENAARYLKSNGRLVYSTCTLRKAENEDTVNAFLDKHIDYELKYQRICMPHSNGTDGFYFAVIQKSR